MEDMSLLEKLLKEKLEEKARNEIAFKEATKLYEDGYVTRCGLAYNNLSKDERKCLSVYDKAFIETALEEDFETHMNFLLSICGLILRKVEEGER